MSRFKIGQRVLLAGNLVSKKCNAYIRDVRVKPSKGGHVEISYVIETATKDWTPDEHFKVVTKKQLKRAENADPEPEPVKKAYPKYYGYRMETYGRIITTVAMVDIEQNPAVVTNLSNDGDTIHIGRYGRRKKMTIGYSIQFPSDEENAEIGIKVAKRRCINEPMATYYSPLSSEFREDMVQAMCAVKLNHIAKNLNKYTSKRRNNV